MAIAFRSKADTSITALTTPHTVNLPASIASGDVLLMAIVSYSTSGIPTTPAGWTLVSSGTLTVNHYWAHYSKTADGSEGATISVSYPANAFAVYEVGAWQGAISGIDTKANTAVLTTSSLAAASVTTANANELVVYLVSIFGGATFNPPAGHTERAETYDATADHTAEINEKLFAAAGATGTPSGSFTQVEASAAVISTVALSPGSSSSMSAKRGAKGAALALMGDASLLPA